MYILLSNQCRKASFSLHQSKQDLKESFRGAKFSVCCTELRNCPVPLHSLVCLFFLKSLYCRILIVLNTLKIDWDIICSLECGSSTVIFQNNILYLYLCYWKKDRIFVWLVKCSSCLILLSHNIILIGNSICELYVPLLKMRLNWSDLF